MRNIERLGRSEVAGRRWRVGAASRTGNPGRRPQPNVAAPRAGDPSRSEPLDRIDTARDAESSCWRSVDGIRPCRRRVARRAHLRRAHLRRADGRRADGRRADGRRADGRRADGRRAASLIARTRLVPRTASPQRRSTRRTEPDDAHPGWPSGRCRHSHRRLRSTQQERRRVPPVPNPRVCTAFTSAFGVRSLCLDLLNTLSTADVVPGLADSVRKTATAPSERLQMSSQRADAPWPLCNDKASRRPGRGSLFRATNAVSEGPGVARAARIPRRRLRMFHVKHHAPKTDALQLWQLRSTLTDVAAMRTP